MYLEGVKGASGEFVHMDYKMHYVLSPEPYPERLTKQASFE